MVLYLLSPPPHGFSSRVGDSQTHHVPFVVRSATANHVESTTPMSMLSSYSGSTLCSRKKIKDAAFVIHFPNSERETAFAKVQWHMSHYSCAVQPQVAFAQDTRQCTAVMGQ